MKFKIRNWLIVGTAAVVFNLLCGCQAMDAEIHHSKLHTDSKMSNAVFLDQLSDSGKNIYVRVFNTSTTSLGDLPDAIKGGLADQGYKIVGNPKKSDYILQVNVLQFGKADMREYDKLYKQSQNFDQSAITAGAAGFGTAMLGGTALTTIGVTAGTALASWLANDLVENETYSLITSVRIETVANGKVTHTYDTAIASKADKVNLKFDEAKPILSEEISKEISSIFADNN